MQPITITINAATVEAANAIRKFATDANANLHSVEHEVDGVLASNRMAMMEFGHSARAMTDGVVAGMSPLRLLAMEAPRLMQAATTLTDELKTKIISFVPAIAGVGLALAAGYYVWDQFSGQEKKATEEAQKLIDALDQIPGLMSRIQTFVKAGIVSPQAGEELAKMLTTKHYRTPSGEITTEPYHASGGPAFTEYGKHDGQGDGQSDHAPQILEIFERALRGEPYLGPGAAENPTGTTL